MIIEFSIDATIIEIFSLVFDETAEHTGDSIIFFSRGRIQIKVSTCFTFTLPGTQKMKKTRKTRNKKI